jgi:hypothetical protein
LVSVSLLYLGSGRTTRRSGLRRRDMGIGILRK